MSESVTKKKNYLIKIYQDWVPLLEKVRAGPLMNQFDYKILKTPTCSVIDKVEVVITASCDNIVFDLGFWLERLREQDQNEHYDLKDTTKVKVDVPAGFLVICNYFGLKPADVLHVFAGDLSQHPFITGGSDERWMAKDYFLRGCSLPHGDYDKAEGLFDRLIEIRNSWGGNHKMDNFKKTYLSEMKELGKEFSKKEAES